MTDLLLWGDDDPSKTIVLVEGEKSARYLQSHLREMGAEHAGIPACWPGGTKSADKAIYDVCRGRKVTLWPDHSPGGREAMAVAGRMAQAAGCAGLKMVDTGNMPTDGDAADVGASVAVQMLIDAKPYNPQNQHNNQQYQNGHNQEPYTPRDPDSGEEKKGWGGPRPNAGRPFSEEQSYKTLSNKRSVQRTEPVSYTHLTLPTICSV